MPQSTAQRLQDPAIAVAILKTNSQPARPQAFEGTAIAQQHATPGHLFAQRQQRRLALHKQIVGA